VLDDDPIAVQFGAAAARIRSRHGLVTPPWLTVARFESREPATFTDDQAVAAALDLHPS